MNKITKTINYIKEKKGQIRPLAKAFFKYPNLYNHPVLFAKSLIDYHNMKKSNGELEQLYNTLPYDLMNDDKSTVRHPHTNARFIQMGYPEDFVRDLGSFKEDADQIDNKSMDDTLGDLEHNEYGIELGQKYPTAPKLIIFDKVLNHYGYPIPARRNRLYGYINNITDEPQEDNNLYNQIIK